MPWPLTAQAAADSYTPATLNVFAQELRATSTDPASRLQWTLGLFYNDSRQVGYQRVVAPYWPSQILEAFGKPIEEVFGQPLLPGDQALYEKEPLSDEQLAAYGQTTWEFAKQVSLVAGARIARETNRYSIYLNGPLNGPAATSFSGTARQTVVDPKFGINFQLDDNNLVYLSAAKGELRCMCRFLCDKPATGRGRYSRSCAPPPRRPALSSLRISLIRASAWSARACSAATRSSTASLVPSDLMISSIRAVAS